MIRNPNRKTILMAIPSLKKGGSERVFSHIANHLDREKYDIHLVVFNSSNIQFDLKSDVRVIALGKKSVLQALPAFVKMIMKVKPDVIFTTLTHLNIVAGMLKIFFYKKKIICRESSVLSSNNEYQPDKNLFNILVRFFYPHLDYIVCQSQEMRDDMVTNFGLSEKKTIVINNPISIPKQKINRDFQVSEPITFITVGRLIESKGFLRILDILANLDLDFRYLIVGEGVFRVEIEKRISKLKLEKRVVLCGLIDNVGDYYKKADIYLHGSYYEGFPNVLLEACSYGIPILSYDTPGVSEIIIEGLNGFIVENDDHVVFATRLKEMIADRLDSQFIQDDIYNRFSTEAILDRYETIL